MRKNEEIMEQNSNQICHLEEMSDSLKNRSLTKALWKNIDKHAEDGTLDSLYLSQVLAQQVSRKEQLIAQKRELQDVTQAGIRERISVCKGDVDALVVQFNALKSKMNKYKKEKLPSRMENVQFYENIRKISQLEKASAYLKVCDHIRTTSEKMEANLETGLDSEAIDLFCNLQTLMKTHLLTTECINLKTYYLSTISHWEVQLKAKLTKDFEGILIAFGWPLNTITATPTLETHEKFHRTIRDLIRLSSSTLNTEEDNNTKLQKPKIVIDFVEGVIPVQIMVAPLKKRFGFHFFGPKATGDGSRPEWYFAQVKTWLRDLVPFIRTHLEPLSVDEINLSSVVDFVRSLSEMIVLKADSQLKAGVDDMIFSKILEESITYENEIVELLGNDIADKDVHIPPIVSTLFSQPKIFQQWLAIEKMACMEKLDEIFKSPSAWNRSVIPGPAEILDLFIAICRFVINRFAHLEQPGQKIQFLKLLIELLDHFRIRCLQIWQTLTVSSNQTPLEDRIDYTIADTIAYVQCTIENWEELPFFTSLSLFMAHMKTTQEKMAKLGLDEMESDFMNENGGDDADESSANIGSPSQGLFSEVNELYECLGEEILKKWARAIMIDLREEIKRGYAKVKWHMYQGQNGSLSPELMSVIPMLQKVKTVVYGGMDSALAEKWLKRVLIEFDEMIMEELVRNKRFSPDAIKQITIDFDAIFTMLLGSPIETSIFFRNMGCTIKVWNLPIGEAMLLHDTLSDTDFSFDSYATALAELDLSLCVSDVIKLLKSRTDLAFQ